MIALAMLMMLADGVHQHPGGKRLPHDKYVHVVPEAVSPLDKVYIPSKDGLGIAAVVRKPRGGGPFPVLLYFHGAPGGRGMDKLVTWARGDTGGPLWERFLQEGFMVVVADYRNNVTRADDLIATMKDRVSYADDGVSVLNWVRQRKDADPERIVVYGVSRGGNLALHLISRERVAGAILGAPAPAGFLGVREGGSIDEEVAARNIAGIQTPVLTLVGTADRLIELDKPLHERLIKAGKKAQLHIFENGYHDFVAGPQGHQGRDEPLMDATLEALELSVKFARDCTAISR
ncbi:MAG TPA: dienelactone hydrolase family protein [Bryobacteraceae bacterium]|nr:dienelactone hydrolase family protein [Bryobacteraceae bacterium]